MKIGDATSPSTNPANKETSAPVKGPVPAREPVPEPPPAQTPVDGTSEIGFTTALAPQDNTVTLGTIMPVAYSVNDIRVISFVLVMEMTDEQSTQAIREALPVFEQATVATVEKFLNKKFYNDILYVKEKLQKRLQTAYNKNLKGQGRVKKISFKEFRVQ